MVDFIDKFELKRAIEVTNSSCGKFINLTIYTPTKSTHGNTIQIPVKQFDEFYQEQRELLEKTNKLLEGCDV